jgi:glycine C-acetyltransferase
MADLEKQLQICNEKGHRFKLIVTDGVFSMDGIVAQLDKICDLAEKYDAMIMVDECHAAGFLGATGRGTPEVKNVMGTNRHHHRNPWKSIRRSHGWLHYRT